MIVTDLSSDDPLHRAVVISLFSWARANDSDPIDDEERHGWWGDSFTGTDKMGSKLWLLRRRKFDRNLLGDARKYAQDALRWMVKEGHVDSVDVLASRSGNERLNLRVTLLLGRQEYRVDFDDVLGGNYGF